MESAFSLIPFVFTLTIWATVEVVADVLITIFEDLSPMSMLQTVIEVAFILRIVGLKHPIAVDDAHTPFAIIQQILAHKHPIAMLQPIDKGSLEGGISGDFQSNAIPLIIGVLAVVPRAIGTHTEPIALSQVIFERPLIEPAILKDHNANSMALAIIHLADVELVGVDPHACKHFASVLDQFGVVGAVPGYAKTTGTCSGRSPLTAVARTPSSGCCVGCTVCENAVWQRCWQMGRPWFIASKGLTVSIIGLGLWAGPGCRRTTGLFSLVNKIGDKYIQLTSNMFFQNYFPVQLALESKLSSQGLLQLSIRLQLKVMPSAYCSSYAQKCLQNCCDKLGQCPSFSGQPCFHFYNATVSPQHIGEMFNLGQQSYVMTLVILVMITAAILYCWFCEEQKGRPVGYDNQSGYANGNGNTMGVVDKGYAPRAAPASVIQYEMQPNIQYQSMPPVNNLLPISFSPQPEPSPPLQGPTVSNWGPPIGIVREPSLQQGSLLRQSQHQSKMQLLPALAPIYSPPQLNRKHFTSPPVFSGDSFGNIAAMPRQYDTVELRNSRKQYSH